MQKGQSGQGRNRRCVHDNDLIPACRHVYAPLAPTNPRTSPVKETGRGAISTVEAPRAPSVTSTVAFRLVRLVRLFGTFLGIRRRRLERKNCRRDVRGPLHELPARGTVVLSTVCHETFSYKSSVTLRRVGQAGAISLSARNRFSVVTTSSIAISCSTSYSSTSCCAISSAERVSSQPCHTRRAVRLSR